MSDSETGVEHGRPWWYRPLWVFAALWAVATIVFAPIVMIDSFLIGAAALVVGFVLLFVSVFASSLEPLFELNGCDSA